MKDEATTEDHGGRWLWLGGCTALAVHSLSSGRLLFAAGVLLLGVFAFYNNPLRPTPSNLAKPGAVIAISWACGLVGIVLILVAAGRAWL